MGGSNTSTKHETSSNTVNPYQMQQYQQNYTHAQDTANSLQPYTGQVTAGFNPNQIQAQGILSGIAQDPKYAAATQQAMGTTQGLLSANPNTQVNAQAVTPTPYNASGYEASLLSAPKPYDAAQLSGTDLSPYLNPYTKNVIDTTLTSQERARQTANMNDNQAATAAGAFGGSRSGVANALTNEAYDRNTGQLVAGLNQANFGQAQGAALSDIGARNAASQFNSNMAYNTGAFNAGAQNTAGQFNAGARNTGGMFNAGQDLAAQQFNSGQNFNAQQSSIQNALAQAGFKLNAAGQLEALNQADLQRAAQQGGILSAVGDAQQQQEQRGYGDAFNLYQSNNNLEMLKQQILSQALGIIPLEQTNTTDGTTTTKQNPGAMGILSGIAGLGLAAATGGSSMGLTSGLGALGGLFGGSLRGQSSGPSMGWS